MLQKAVHWGLLASIFLYIASGLGILYPRIAEAVTFGLLAKTLAFRIHTWLLFPFLVILILHLYIVLRKRK